MASYTVSNGAITKATLRNQSDLPSFCATYKISFLHASTPTCTPSCCCPFSRCKQIPDIHEAFSAGQQALSSAPTLNVIRLCTDASCQRFLSDAESHYCSQ